MLPTSFETLEAKQKRNQLNKTDFSSIRYSRLKNKNEMFKFLLMKTHTKLPEKMFNGNISIKYIFLWVLKVFFLCKLKYYLYKIKHVFTYNVSLLCYGFHELRI